MLAGSAHLFTGHGYSGHLFAQPVSPQVVSF
jgi:hypothetical protein